MVHARSRNAKWVAARESQTEKAQDIEPCIRAIFEHNDRADYNEEFWYYNRSIVQGDGLRRLIREIADDFALAGVDPAGKIVLDAGCGYGIRALIIRLMGAAEVRAIDILPHRIETLKRILGLFPQFDNVHPTLGDVSHTGYPDASVDLVFSNEAISHYPDVPGFLKESARILKPGGTLFISDCNNGANPWQVVESLRLWSRFEKGPPGVIGRNKVETPMRVLRERMIREYAPNLANEQVHQLVVGTFGYRASEIHAATDRYRATGQLPTSYYRPGVVPTWPDRGYVIEDLVVPWRLLRQFRRVGLTGRVYSHVGGSNGRPLIRALNRAVQLASPLTWPIARALKIVAHKPRA